MLQFLIRSAPATLLLLVFLAIATGGCHKQTPATSTPTAGQPGQGGAAATAQPLAGEVHPLMTSQLRLFIQETGRSPTNFLELARARLDRVPRTPPGMTWAIDPVTLEVKLVKK